MTKTYKVVVDDNYNYMDADARYTVGSYDSLVEAVEKCEELTITSLKHLYEKGITPDELSAQWALFGEDPFIIGADGSVPFSARKFINTPLCEAVIGSLSIVDRD